MPGSGILRTGIELRGESADFGAVVWKGGVGSTRENQEEQNGHLRLSVVVALMVGT